MKSIFYRQIYLGFIIVLLAFFANMRPAHADPAYQEYFKEYVLSIKNASNPVECKNIADAKLQKKIKLGKIYNEKARTPAFAMGKWGYTGPDDAERQAATDVGALCEAPQDEVFNLAYSYEQGESDIGKDVQVATGLYMYLFFAHKHGQAIEQLEGLGFIVQ